MPINAAEALGTIVENDLYVSRVFNHMGIGHNMPILVDNKAGSTSIVKETDFDFYRDDRWTNTTICLR